MEITIGRTHTEVTMQHLEYGSVIAGSWLNPFSVLKVSESGRATLGQIIKEAGIPYYPMFFIAWQQIEYFPQFYDRRPVPMKPYSYLDYVNHKWKVYSMFKPVGNSSQPFEQVIADAQTGLPLIYAMSTMVNIDPKTRRPAPYHPYLKEFFSNADYSPPVKIGHLMQAACQKRYEMPTNAKHFSKSSDITVLQIDRNGHVNQAFYMNICLDCLGDAFARSVFDDFSSIFDYDLRRISFLYLKECHFGDTVDTKVWQDDGNPLVFKFHVRKPDGLLFQAEIEFFPLRGNIKSRL